MRQEYWLADCSEDACVVMVFSDTAGVFSLQRNNETFTASVDPSSNYGIARFDVTGLAGQETCTLLFDGSVIATPTLRVMPSATDEFYVAFVSCQNHAMPNYWPYIAMRRYNIRAVFFQDDMPYADGNTHNSTRWGDAVEGGYTAWDTDGREAYDRMYLTMFDQFGMRDLMTHVPVYFQYGDHAIGDNWDHENVAAQFNPAPATQAEIDGVFADAMAAWDSWAGGNPANNDSEAANYKPSNAAAGTPASNYPPRYFRKTIGPVEFFCLDTTGHKCPVSKADNGNLISADATAKTMLGEPQFDWLKARVVGSSATFKAIMSPSAFYNQVSASQADWVEYQTERDHLAGYLSSNATGVFVCSGDTHAPYVASDPDELTCINACSLGQQTISGGSSRWTDSGATNVWRLQGEGLITPDERRNAFGLLRITPEFVEPMIVSVEGEVLWRGRIEKGSNALTYPQTRISS